VRSLRLEPSNNVRLSYLLRFYIVTVAAFVAAKPLFMFYNRAHRTFSFADVFDVVRNGLSLDLSTALYFILLPFVVALVSLWVKRWSVLRAVLCVYAVIAAIAIALGLVSDACLYAFWGFKLNASVLPYLEQPEGITASVSMGWLALRALVLTLVVAVLARRFWPPLNVKSVSSRTAAWGTVVGVLMIPLLIIGLRGGTGVSTTNIGQVYFSQNQFLNHSAVNPVFSFLSSFGHREDEYNQYNFFDDEECRRLLEGVYDTRSELTDTLLRVHRPNIIIIVMEGAGSIFTETCGRADVMPRLSSLMHEGVCFAQCYGNSWRTDRGTLCALSGYPSFPNTSVMKLPEKCAGMSSVAKSLAAQGYNTTYLYGGDINFTNMRGYLLATGWQRLISEDDYPAETLKDAKWGVHDHLTMQTLAELAETNKEPFLIGYSSLSSHEPWEVPMEKKFDDEVLNAFYYLDQCIGSFIDRLKRSPRWANTLVVILPDHSITYQDIDETKPERNRIPLVWTGGAVARPCTINQICNQSDLAATLLGQLGVPHNDFPFSRDVMSATYRRPFAVHNYNNAQSMIDSTGFVLYDFDARRFVVKQSVQADRMLLLNKAILQATSADLKQR